MNKIVVVFLCAFILTISSCSKDSGDSDQTSSGDVQQFLKDYEKLATEYCDVTKGYKEAPMEKKMELMKKFADYSLKMQKHNENIVAIEAKMSDDDKQKLEELEGKMEKCADMIGK